MPSGMHIAVLPFCNWGNEFNRENTNGIRTDHNNGPSLLNLSSYCRIKIYEPYLPTPNDHGLITQ